MATEPMSQTTLHPNGGTLERDFSHQGQSFNHKGSPYELKDAELSSEEALRRIRTAGSIAISPELFEKIYLTPQIPVKGDLRKTFGNPTPLGLLGFLMAVSPLACDLMGWRGAGGNGAASIGAFFFFGGLLMILASVMEFILGNTFSFVVFGAFGAFNLTFAATLQPFYNAYGAYAPAGEAASAGLETVGFNSSFAFVMLFMGVLCLIFLVCSLRTNLAFVVIFFTLVLTFGFLAGAYFNLSLGNVQLAGKLVVAAGATAFVTCIAGWWLFIAIMLAALDFPFELPVGDLSGLIKGRRARLAAKENIV